ncbi:MAG: ribosome recycling factor, partial [Desulfuromonadales bacterium]|nr:ribosome recycling factor [Desulfuromonadales bacterium]NIS41613.1 ribosome recycling factor [Desulfuromonadales bacterium]
NPQNDGTIIRIPMPELSEERRKEYVKLVGKLAEEARVSVRNIRRNELDVIKKQQKDGDLPEDEAHRLSDEIQKVTDE